MIVMRHRAAARLTTALALVAASLAWAGPARAAEGFSVRLGQAPATFTIGKAAKSLTAVASTDRERRCHRVRWSLTIRTDGVSLNQVRVNRIENGQAFRVRAQLGNDAARVTDAQADPGQLCRGQNVTGRWDIAFTGPDSGTVTFEARALDAAGRELAATTLTSRVVTPVAATTGPTPAPTATEDPAGDQVAGDAAAGTPSAGESTSAALNPAAGTPSVLGPGLIIGAALVFLGVALLLRIRTRNRRDPAWQAKTQTLPTGFYSMPRDRRRSR
jgi:hypothetical protein